MRSLFRKIREANRPFCTALVAAAGSSSRMGGVDKLMEFLDGVPVLPSHRFFFDRVKSLLTIRLREEEASEHIAPVPLPLTIVYEDEDLLVLDKPPDMPIHPSMGNYENTLANALAYYYEQQERPFIFRCINRLDRDTSGLLIVAKNAYSSVVLSAQMKERHIHREYLAVVQGLAPERGTIDAPIGRQPGSVIARCVDPVSGEPAITHYTRVAASPDGTYSLMRIHLDTGLLGGSPFTPTGCPSPIPSPGRR